MDSSNNFSYVSVDVFVDCISSVDVCCDSLAIVVYRIFVDCSKRLNATQTPGAIIGIHGLEHILDAHALNILLHKVAAMRNATG